MRTFFKRLPFDNDLNSVLVCGLRVWDLGRKPGTLLKKAFEAAHQKSYPLQLKNVRKTLSLAIDKECTGVAISIFEPTYVYFFVPGLL